LEESSELDNVKIRWAATRKKVMMGVEIAYMAKNAEATRLQEEATYAAKVAAEAKAKAEAEAQQQLHGRRGWSRARDKVVMTAGISLAAKEAHRLKEKANDARLAAQAAALEAQKAEQSRDQARASWRGVQQKVSLAAQQDRDVTMQRRKHRVEQIRAKGLEGWGRMRPKVAVGASIAQQSKEAAARRERMAREMAEAHEVKKQARQAEEFHNTRRLQDTSASQRLAAMRFQPYPSRSVLEARPSEVLAAALRQERKAADRTDWSFPGAPPPVPARGLAPGSPWFDPRPQAAVLVASAARPSTARELGRRREAPRMSEAPCPVPTFECYHNTRPAHQSEVSNTKTEHKSEVSKLLGYHLVEDTLYGTHAQNGALSAATESSGRFTHNRSQTRRPGTASFVGRSAGTASFVGRPGTASFVGRPAGTASFVGRPGTASFVGRL